MQASLVQPPTAEELVLAEEEVPLARPLMFGDVIENVPCSLGGSPLPLAMIVTHPCSMRRGQALRPRMVVAEVGAHDQRVSLERWTTGYWDLFPIDGLDLEPRKPTVVRLLELHSVDSGAVSTARRILCLTEYGIAALLQRWIFQLSRDKVVIAELAELIAPVMVEAEMQEDWCAAALAFGGGGPSTDVLAEAAAAFQEALGVPRSGGFRDWLDDPARRADVRRQIAALRRQRYGA
jgi:hypothetical protein